MLKYARLSELFSKESDSLMPRFSYYVEMARQIHSLKAAPKVWNYLKYRCLRRKARTSVWRYTPQIASLHLTLRCNLDCGYCNAAKIFHEGVVDWRQREADLEKVKRIFTNPLLANCLLVDLLGGEPLLVEDLDRIVAFLTKGGHISNVSTNGLLLADRIADLKRAGISRINLSLYDANRSVIERDLVKINRVFPVHMSFVLLRSMVEGQFDKLLEMACFIRDAGCLSLRFWMYRPIGVDPQPEEVIIDTHPAYLEFRQRMEEALPGFCVWPAAVKKEGAKRLCPQLWQRICCDVSGNVGICCGTDRTLEGANSNLFDAEPDVVFNHPTLIGMREQLINPRGSLPDICKSCNLLGEPGW